jgi:hypothetical protein
MDNIVSLVKKVKLNLGQRLWLIDSISALPSSTTLIKKADEFIGSLAPTQAEIETYKLSIGENGIEWDKDLEATNPAKEFEVEPLTYRELKVKYATFGDPTSLDLEMIEILGL